MWVLIEGTSFSGLLWANTLKSKSVLCACSPTRLSSLWLCLQDSRDCMRRTVHLTCCSTFLGSFLCLAATNWVPMVDPGHPQLVPEKGGTWGSVCLVPQAGTRVGSGCGRVSEQAGHPAAPLQWRYWQRSPSPARYWFVQNPATGGEVSHTALWPNTKMFPLPPFFASFWYCGTSKIRKRIGWQLLDPFLPWFCSAIKRQENKWWLSGPSLTQTLWTSVHGSVLWGLGNAF